MKKSSVQTRGLSLGSQHEDVRSPPTASKASTASKKKPSNNAPPLTIISPDLRRSSRTASYTAARRNRELFIPRKDNSGSNQENPIAISSSSAESTEAETRDEDTSALNESSSSSSSGEFIYLNQKKYVGK